MADDDAIREAFGRDFPTLAGSKWHDYELHVYASGWRACEAAQTAQTAAIFTGTPAGEGKPGCPVCSGSGWTHPHSPCLCHPTAWPLSANRLQADAESTDRRGDDDATR